MVWIKERVTDDGDKRFVACYRDPEGRQRSAGTYSSRRAAERAAHREEAKVGDGAWHDHSRGQVTFAEYVETVWLPPSRSRPPPWPPTGPTSTSTSSPPSDAGRWARSCPRRSNGGSPQPPSTVSRPPVSGSTTPCCTRCSNVPSATGWSPSTPAPTPSCPSWSRTRPEPSPPRSTTPS